MNDYIIRKAKYEDCLELSKLKIKIWKQVYIDIYPKEKIDNYSIEENKNKFMKLIDNKEADLYVVELDNKIIAYTSSGVPIRKYKDYKQEIGLLYIDLEYRNLGLGRKLFTLGYNNIKEKGYKEFFISCNKYNVNARGFYEKMGGLLIDTDPDYQDKSLSQVKYLYKID